jgi:hypothetical protein
MPETIIKEIIKKRESQKLLKLGVFRSERGIEIIAESEAIENFFKNYGLDEGEIKWGDSLPYKYPSGFDDHFVQEFHYWKKGLFVNRDNSTVNLSWLRAQGLGEGITFVIDNQIYSKTEISKFVKEAREEIKKFFDQYMKPVNVTVEIVFTINDDTE